MTRALNIAAFVIAFGAFIGFADVAFATSAPAAKTATPARAYTEVLVDEKHNDPKAEAIARKILDKDIREAETMISKPAYVYAQFISLGEGQPKTSIIARIMQPAMCGSSGCQLTVLQPTGKNNAYRNVWDTALLRVFTMQRPGHAYIDFLAIVGPRATEGFGVWFWNDKKQEYQFAGLSKFSK